MPDYPFTKDNKKQEYTDVELTAKEEETRRRDQDETRNHKEYHQLNHKDWLGAGSLYNLMQEGTDDPVSNFFLGWSRMYIDQFLSMTTQAPPEFDFDPGPQDYKLAVIYKALCEHLLNQGDFQSHLRRWMTDMTIFGPGCLHSFVRMPMRMDRYENREGNMVETMIRDLRKPKVGLEHMSIWRSWRSGYDSDPNVDSAGGFELILTRAQFVQDFANAYLPSGKPKYKYMDKLTAMNGTHYKVTVLFHDVRNEYCVYALPFGTKEEGKEPSVPAEDLGIPILDKPLKRKRYTLDGQVIESGHNVLGSVPLIWGTFDDRLDNDFKSYSRYGMGLPRMMDGPESIMNALFNMTIDNMRLKNTVVLSYKSYTGKDYPDLDASAFYSGQWVDGEVTPQSLGVADVSSNGVMWEWLGKVFTDLTGINPSINSQDPARTAFEMAQKIRANNARAEHRLKGLEMPLKRAGHSLLANALSEYTTPEWEAVTDEQASEIARLIKEGAMSSDDFDPAKKRKRNIYMFPVEGRKFREDFKSGNKRRLDRESTNNTLIEDKTMVGNTSHIPAAKEYLLPMGDIEKVLEFGVRVDSSRMLGDQRAQDQQTFDGLLTNLERVQALKPGEKLKIDPEKLLLEQIEYSQIDPRKVMTGEDEKSEQQNMVEESIKALTNPAPTPQPNVQSPGMAQATPDAGQFASPAGSQIGPQAAVQNYAAGTV